MKTDRTIAVSQLDDPHRLALEEIIGSPLGGDQQLLIRVIDEPQATENDSRPTQSLEEWDKLLDGLTEDEIEKFDNVVNSRARLGRKLL